jgi:heme O synthase-like polyprenyltransferase
MEWGKILFIIAAILMAFFLYRSIKGHPEWFSSKNLNKSLFTFGILALILIAFIGLLVVLLRIS